MRRTQAWRVGTRALIVLCCLPAFLPAQVGTGSPQEPGQLATTQAVHPLSIREKFDYRVVQSFGLRGFLGAGVGAAIGQAEDRPKEWGEGASGFATRYGSSFAGNFSRQAMTFAMESSLHEDPRYFPSEDKGFTARLKSVLVQTVTTRTDYGTRQIAYARISSAFATGQLVNAWQPRSTGSVGDGFMRGAIMLGGDAGYNFLQEFVPFLRPHTLRHHN
jgi:hypothetical protein